MPQIVLLSSDETDMPPQILGGFSEPVHIPAPAGWSEACASADAVIVDFPRCRHEDYARVRWLKQKLPTVTFISLTHFSRSNVAAAVFCGVNEVVWIDEAEYSLEGAVRRACAANLLNTLARGTDECTTLPRSVAVAIGTLLRCNPPLVSVQQLSREIGFSNAASLSRAFRSAALTTGSQVRLYDLIRLIVLFRAALYRFAGFSWTESANRLGVSRRRLRRTARDVLGRQLSDIVDPRTPSIVNRLKKDLASLGVLP